MIVKNQAAAWDCFRSGTSLYAQQGEKLLAAQVGRAVEAAEGQEAFAGGDVVYAVLAGQRQQIAPRAQKRLRLITVEAEGIGKGPCRIDTGKIRETPGLPGSMKGEAFFAALGKRQ